MSILMAFLVFSMVKKMNKELKWHTRFIRLANEVATWSSCIRINRQVGAIIVKNNRVITTGYNGAPERIPSCIERNSCLRDKLHIESGKNHELCYAIHAEQNAILQAAKQGISIQDATFYCTHQPCVICAKMIINSGIKQVIYENGYPDPFALDLLMLSNVEILRYGNLLNAEKNDA